MTTGEWMVAIVLYSAALVLLAWITGAGIRRILGALAGGAAFGFVGLSAVWLGESRGWWRVPASPSPWMVWLGFAISCAPVYLVTWWVARRFGARGLTVCALAAAVIGPPRDYSVARMFPEWIVFSPGLTPVIAVALTYASLVLVGHAVMRIVAGPSGSAAPD